MHLRRRDHAAAARSALEALERLYHYPLAHFFLGIALRGMKEYRRAAGAFRTALVAQSQLSPGPPAPGLDPGPSAQRIGPAPPSTCGFTTNCGPPPRTPRKAEAGREPRAVAAIGAGAGPPSWRRTRAQSTCPRVGKGAGGGLGPAALGHLDGHADAGGRRTCRCSPTACAQADTDNPRGYFEFEPVKQLHRTRIGCRRRRGKPSRSSRLSCRTCPPVRRVM